MEKTDPASEPASGISPTARERDAILGMGSGSILVLSILAFATLVGFLASRAGNPESLVRQQRLEQSNRVTAAAIAVGPYQVASERESPKVPRLIVGVGNEAGKIEIYSLSADDFSSSTVALSSASLALELGQLHRSEIYTLVLEESQGGRGHLHLAATSRDGRTSFAELIPRQDETGAYTPTNRQYVGGKQMDRWGLAYSPDQRILAVGGYNPNFALVGTRGSGGTPFFTEQAHSFWYDVLAWAPESSVYWRVAAGSAGAAGLNILYYQMDDHFWMKGLGHDGGIRSVAWSPNGVWLATGGDEDRLVRLWSDDLALPEGAAEHAITYGYEAIMEGAAGAVTHLDWATNQVLFAAGDEPPALYRLEKPVDTYGEGDGPSRLVNAAAEIVLDRVYIPYRVLALRALGENTVVCVDDEGAIHLQEF